MGWNVNGLLVAGAVEVGALPGHTIETGEILDLGSAYSRPVDYAVAAVGGWTSILDPHILVTFDDEAALAIAGERRLLAYATHSVSDTYGFAWYSGAQSIRRVIYSRGEIADEAGGVLPEEARLEPGYDEDFIIDIVTGLTGLDWSQIVEADYRVWSAP
ncbi:hypothetical protein ACFO5K_13675 [Nocardia halotolerans]|uniref:Uncharacterized protein n=1 Tax=Nocardia halotolerans TaxID=1755878 RepID=A0ABV8VGI8_9NOCA